MEKTTDPGEVQHEKCRIRVEKALTTNKNIQKLVESIKELGCTLPPNLFKCRPCDGDISGGFVPNLQNEDTQYEPSIIICQDKFLPKVQFENTIVHELIHAYDQCRINIDWKNCLHHACTEVRAAALSGECKMYQEILRGNFQPQGGGKVCIERRANLSVSANQYCKNYAKESVAKALEPCMKDSSPF